MTSRVNAFAHHVIRSKAFAFRLIRIVSVSWYAIFTLSFVFPNSIGRLFNMYFPWYVRIDRYMAVRYGSIMMVVFSLLPIAAFLSEWHARKEWEYPLAPLDLLTVWSKLSLIFGAGSLIFSYILFEQRRLDYHNNGAGLILLSIFRVNIIVMFVAAGGILYVFKRRNKVLYGCIEVLAGLIVNWTVLRIALPGVERGSITLIQGLAFIGTLYFFSRGFGNIVEGLEDRKKGLNHIPLSILQGTEEEGF